MNETKKITWGKNNTFICNTLVLFLLMVLSGQLKAQQISIIGNATPANDWETDYDMTETAPGSGIWTIELFLTDGPAGPAGCKFRQDHSWITNWGGTEFPTGTAVLNSGDNIPVDATALYEVSFNVNTLAYSFTTLTPRNVGIGTTNPASTLDVDGGIRSSYSGTAYFVLNQGTNTYTRTIQGVPSDMVGVTGSLVLASISDGCEGLVVKASVTSSTTMDVTVTNHCGTQSSTRLNYIIFKL